MLGWQYRIFSNDYSFNIILWLNGVVITCFLFNKPVQGLPGASNVEVASRADPPASQCDLLAKTQFHLNCNGLITKLTCVTVTQASGGKCQNRAEEVAQARNPSVFFLLRKRQLGPEPLLWGKQKRGS